MKPHRDIFRAAPKPSLKVDVTNLVHVHITILDTVLGRVRDVARLQVLQAVLYHIERLLLHIVAPQMGTAHTVHHDTRRQMGTHTAGRLLSGARRTLHTSHKT